VAGQYHGKDNEMSDKFLMFVPLEKQPTRTEVGWWIYDSDILTTSQMVDRIEQEMDLPSGVVDIQNGVWGLMVDAWKVTL
jgi:hypothetical protein